ncbi:hypothetical protein GE278_15630 [Enterobacteriaceae bacterium Kacie_13]|nr:hypothetical protein GE278_15630 [Enterobacteriaceae bacterium Kacie_13]
MNKIFSLTALCFMVFASAGCSNKLLPVQQQVKPGREACNKEFVALGKLDPNAYALYTKQFAEINKSYATFKAQGDNLNKDAKEVLGLEIDAKLQLVCARVKNSAFQNMQKRSVELNAL